MSCSSRPRRSRRTPARRRAARGAGPPEAALFLASLSEAALQIARAEDPDKAREEMFDYIVKNNLNTQAGLKAAYAKSFQVVMPTESISVKGDWVPVQTLLQWKARAPIEK